MNKATSIYLDAIRFLAALAVFFHHVFELGVVSTDIRINFAREAVMVFFVLSGFVISYVAKNKEHNVKDYLIARLSRLYSVVLPALMLTLILDIGGMVFEPSLYDENAHQNVLLRLIVSFFYLNQIWNFTVLALSNGPFWSIAYEFWYYLIFASAFYFKGTKGVLISFLLIMIAGPKIILLFPCWLIGVGAQKIYSSTKNYLPSLKFVFPISIIMMFLVIHFGYPTQWLVDVIKTYLVSGYLDIYGYKVFIGGNAGFINDYLFCILFAASIISADAFFNGVSESKRLTFTIRYLAGNTFSLYLYHVPLLLFFQSIFYSNPNIYISQFLILALTLILVFLLASVTEHKKGVYVKLFERIFEWILKRVTFIKLR